MMEDWRDAEGNIDPQRISAGIEALGKVWADLQHAAALLEKTKDATFAQMVLARVEGGESRAKAELAVKASDDWLNHIYAMVDAKLAANRAKVQYEAAKAGYEAIRTQEATRREEMRHLDRR